MQDDKTEINENADELEAQEDIDALHARIKELEDKYLRNHADFENTKKRLEREKAQSLEYAYESFAQELLPVIDSLEAGIVSVDGSCIEESMKDKFKEGLLLTLENFKKVLERYGITEIVAVGEFNPNIHNAVMQEDSPDHEDGQIVQILQKGYQYKERVLRPALVKVCKK